LLLLRTASLSGTARLVGSWSALLLLLLAGVEGAGVDVRVALARVEGLRLGGRLVGRAASLRPRVHVLAAATSTGHLRRRTLRVPIASSRSHARHHLFEFKEAEAVST
jgi:hypothetical protein